jgi:two-component system LytT family response regulator
MEKRIPLVTQHHIHLIEPSKIVYCKCNNTSTTFHLTNQEVLIISKGIKAVESLLKDAHFIRPHQSYLVNLEHIVRIDKNDSYNLVLSNNEKIPSAIRRRKEMLQIIKSGM